MIGNLLVGSGIDDVREQNGRLVVAIIAAAGAKALDRGDCAESVTIAGA